MTLNFFLFSGVLTPNSTRQLDSLIFCRFLILFIGKESIMRLKRYSKPEDGDVLKEIEKLLKERPSYGYKR